MPIFFIFLLLNFFSNRIEIIYLFGACKVLGEKIPYNDCSSYFLSQGVREVPEIKIDYPFTVLTGSNSMLLLKDKDILILIEEYNIVELNKRPTKFFDNELLEYKGDSRIIEYEKAKKHYPSLKIKVYKKRNLVQKDVNFSSKIDKYKYYLIRISKSQDFMEFDDIISKSPKKDIRDFKKGEKEILFFKIAGIINFDEKNLYITNFNEEY